MSILDKLNKISGKTADNIEEAIDNIEAGGGGGDDSGALYVTVEEDMTTWSSTSRTTTLTISESKETIVNAVRAGQAVFFIANLTLPNDGEAVEAQMTVQHLAEVNAIAADNSAVMAVFVSPVLSGLSQIVIEHDMVWGMRSSM